MERTILKEMKTSKNLWAKIVVTVVSIMNWSPTSALKNQTPYEALIGSKPKVDHFRIFWSMGHDLVDYQMRRKFNAKS